MIGRDWDLLFSDYDLREFLGSRLAAIDERVLGIREGRFATESDDLLAASVASELVVSRLEVREEGTSVSCRDTKVDVSHDFNRAVWDRSQPTYVDGIEVTYHLPFTAEPELWRCRPSSFTLNPPRAVIAPGELQFPYDQADRDVAATKAQFQEDLSRLKEWLPWVNQQVDEHNSMLESRARKRVSTRRAELKRTRRDLDALGYRIRPADFAEPNASTEAQCQESMTARREASRHKAQRAYDVALSFAGEERGYVEKVAERLKGLGVTVFYDRFEQVNLWGKDLAEHLGNIYSKDSRFVVIFASRAYAGKAWPTHEKRFALSRHLSGGGQSILPVRFDDTEIPGIPPTIGYLDLRVLTPEKLAELIRQKVDAESGE